MLALIYDAGKTLEELERLEETISSTYLTDRDVTNSYSPELRGRQHDATDSAAEPHINWHKMTVLTKIVEEAMKGIAHVYPFDAIPAIQALIKKSEECSCNPPFLIYLSRGEAKTQTL